MSLDPVVSTQIAKGQIARLDIVRFDIPGLPPKGYHMGGRDLTFNGLTYLPNRFLAMGSMISAVGTAVTTRTLTFSNIPVNDPDDAMAIIEQYDYQNAPTIISHLCGVPNTNQILGVLASSIYEIDQVRYNKGALEGTERTLTMEIDLQPPGRSARGSTGVKRSAAEQNFDNDATDTGLEYVATNASIPEEWGQVSR